MNPETLRLYAVTGCAPEDLLEKVAAVIDGGARIVQLREKRLTGEALRALAADFTALCREKGALSILNDDPALALAVGADGVHVGQDDLEAGRARALLGPGKILGVSAHNPAEALRAQAAGADYLGVGAAFVTGTKRDARPIAHECYRAVTAAVSIPVVAIGGVGYENMTELAGSGIAGVAVVSALFGAADPAEAARRLRARAEALFGTPC